MDNNKFNGPKDCDKLRVALSDTLTVIGGKWKLPIISVLLMDGEKQFNQLSRELRISPRILSKELAELEINNLVLRVTRNTKPVTVEYSATQYCESLVEVIMTLNAWGVKHREVITGKNFQA
ncbi:HxlR family transcriptional regulator [Flavobacterium araucananum]|uniref:HxlR family transcriptional regulator n=1 Tax=Flavobacterium araucananum TaxID=946678 RepID=A0A227P3M0_9FLAO|nr:helix-turn-helix domain-containing protein [Flavobacterium araucananum]OXG03984.1 HxlR family transcriptional regulator [Flavobacterium araucananum]PWJ98471.1 HxlR family transcriptional regulator [Flavobacterium araucananum]